MNPMDQLLQDELNRMLDRIAAGSSDGALGEVAARRPELRQLMEAAETRLTTLRARFLEGYAEWERAVEECEGLWALARLGQENAPAQARAA